MISSSVDKMNDLLNISPIDGRYRDTTKVLNNYLSEHALIRYRLLVEIKWLLYLIDKDIISIKLDNKEKNKIDSIINNFNINDSMKVKEIEKTTKHDVKAIEYYLRDKLKELDLQKLNPFIHITLTSEDINNISYNLMFRDALFSVYHPKINEFIDLLNEYSNIYKSQPMLSHTHGQNATPTTIGKEMKVFAYRLKSILALLKNIKLRSKCSGAVGNYNCHVIAYPNIDWIKISKEFVENFNLEYNPLTTQIESHDILCVALSYLKIINNIIKDFNSDMWLYISRNYFYEKVNKNEIGSSVMPHKVNPINHENSMANIEISNSLCDALINNLSISRMQRDLSDSSKLRNLGVILAHSIISIEQSIIGLNKLEINKEIINQELDNNYMVLTEAVQTIMRKNGCENAYELLKELSRGKELSKEQLHDFINSLNINIDDKKILLALTPSTYIGLAKEIVDNN